MDKRHNQYHAIAKIAAWLVLIIFIVICTFLVALTYAETVSVAAGIGAGGAGLSIFVTFAFFGEEAINDSRKTH